MKTLLEWYADEVTRLQLQLAGPVLFKPWSGDLELQMKVPSRPEGSLVTVNQASTFASLAAGGVSEEEAEELFWQYKVQYTLAKSAAEVFPMIRSALAESLAKSQDPMQRAFATQGARKLGFLALFCLDEKQAASLLELSMHVISYLNEIEFVEGGGISPIAP